MRISLQFFLSVLLILGVTVYYIVDAANSELKPRYREAVEENLADTANILALFLVEQAHGGALDTELLERVFTRAKDIRVGAQIYELVKDTIDLRISVTDGAGRVLYDSFQPENIGLDFSKWRNILLALQGQYGARTTRDNPSDATSTVLYVSAPVVVDGRILGVVTVAKPTQSSNVFIRLAQKRLFRGTLILVVVIALLSVLMVVFVTRPIRKLTTYARAVRDGVPAQLPKIGSSDIGELAEAFQEMREALEGKQYIERYVQSLTHELKSPIAGIRGAAELLREQEVPAEKREQFLSNIVSETQRLQNIIERLLELAAVEKLERIEQLETVDLAAMLRQVVDAILPRLEQKGLKVNLELPGSLCIDADPFLLRQSFRNILDNAADFSPKNARIDVRLTDSIAVPNTAEVVVEDFGPGIPAYALEKVFERFFSLPRVDTGRKGSGLGLTFVAEVVKLHRGTITVENRPGAGITEGDSGERVKVGSGARVTVLLPKKPR
ncbi:MAG: two-component system sensor histidine kinase CreC [Bdellovibrionota bacterium]